MRYAAGTLPLTRPPPGQPAEATGGDQDTPMSFHLPGRSAMDHAVAVALSFHEVLAGTALDPRLPQGQWIEKEALRLAGHQLGRQIYASLLELMPDPSHEERVQAEGFAWMAAVCDQTWRLFFSRERIPHVPGFSDWQVQHLKSLDHVVYQLTQAGAGPDHPVAAALSRVGDHYAGFLLRNTLAYERADWDYRHPLRD